ncbi:MAG: hypothetical protein ACI4XH_02365 [Acutalibacteraceae bacterium]
MSSKKNKSKNKPAVGSPAAGSNNTKKKSARKQPEKQIEVKRSVAEKQKEKSKKKKHSAPDEQREKQKKQKAPAVKKQKKPTTEKQGETQKKPGFIESFKLFSQKYNMFKIAAAAVIAIALLGAVIIFTVNLLSVKIGIPDEVANAEFKGRLEPETVAVSSSVSPQQQKKLAKALKPKGNNSAFDFYVNDEIIIDEYDDPALLEFGSVSENDCVLMFFILDEDDNIIYRSLGVKPGCEVRSVSFFDELPYGTHKAKIVVNGYDAQTNKKVGTQCTEIKIKIGVDSLEK